MILLGHGQKSIKPGILFAKYVFWIFRNPGYKTIEEDLMKAFRDAEIISDEWYENPQKCFFQRASRTDKGVSAARMVMSLKLCKLNLKTNHLGIFLSI